MIRTKSTDLSYAHLVWRQAGVMPEEAKRSAVERLASFGFSSKHIAQIVDRSYAWVEKIVNHKGRIGGVRGWSDKFEPKTLDALGSLAYDYELQGTVSIILLARIVRWGTGMHTVSYMTGIPIERLREELRHGILR